jgi:hypothetical protein
VKIPDIQKSRFVKQLMQENERRVKKGKEKKGFDGPRNASGYDARKHKYLHFRV